MVYDRPTALLGAAHRVGARAAGGLEMLVQQGALAFALWTGRAAPVDVMRAAAQAEMTAISERLVRAATAKGKVEFLVTNLGIDPSRLTSRGYGETMPIATNDTDSGRALNRRVEFKILGEK